MKTSCIIIGAGASGLMAAHHLIQAGCSVSILEARKRVGGRIYTLATGNFSSPVEAGAEFIHGDLPLTSSLLKQANVPWRQMEGDMFRVHEGHLQKGDFFKDEWEQLLTKLKPLKVDMTLDDFLQKNFSPEKHPELYTNVKRFVEGYNAADIKKVSALALRNEWSENEDPIQYRPEGGYGRLITFLVNEVTTRGARLHQSTAVEKIIWNKQKVEVLTNHGSFSADKVLLTVPLSVLDKLKFEPDLPDHRQAATDIGFGSVIKFIFEFQDAVWENDADRPMPRMKFLFSDAPIPTWWSQLPDKRPLLTGWLGGPLVEEMPDDSGQLFGKAIDSLAYVLGKTSTQIQSNLRAWHIENWDKDPFSRGAYSYAKINTPQARRVFSSLSGAGSVIFWAGEALYNGPHTGTVEAALTSGRDAAHRMIELH
jgi:monoamine oxidase